MKCEMKGCTEEAIGVIEGVDGIKSELAGEEVHFRLNVCLEHKRQWEVGWRAADQGIGLTGREAQEIAQRELTN